MKPLALPSLPRFSRAELLFSAKCFASSMLAFWVASAAGLPRPFWAVMTTYIVAAPMAGNVRSKALFRFCGTLIGCTVVVLIVPALANAPVMLTLALSLWVGTCLFVSLQDRSASSYVFMLAGYTAALIGFPSVETPLNLFDNAVARVEEIGLGILSATLVHSLVFPVGMGPTLLALLDRGVGDARRWFADVLRRDAQAGATGADRQRLASDITQLRLLSTHVPFDTSHLRWTAGAIAAMQDELAALTPALSAVEDRLQALAAAEGALPDDVVALLAKVSDWLQAPTEGDARDAAMRLLLDDLRRYEPAGAGLTPWGRALRIGAAVRLDELVQGWRECERLRQHVDAGLAGAPVPARRGGTFANRVLHKDRGLALLSAIAAILAICLCSAFWILTAWPSGSVAAMMAAVFCCFFATMDDPVPAIKSFNWFTILSIPVSAVYVLVLLPAVHDFGMLAAVCAPMLLVLGAYIGRAATAPAALAMVMGVIGTLSMHDTAANVDLPTFFNGTLAQVLGVYAAALVTRLVRTVGADWSAQRIRRATWRELGAMAGAARGSDIDEAYVVRMVDRIALLAPRVADPAARDETVEGALRDLRAGLDIAALQRARARLPAMGLGVVSRGVGRLFNQRGAGRAATPPATLLAEVDAALAGALAPAASERDAARAAVTALVGLRRTLFPAAPALAAPAAVPQGS